MARGCWCLRAVKARQQAGPDPLKEEYSETESKLGQLADKIRVIDPSWKPPTPPKMPEKALIREVAA
jgi:hypothetical protein